MPNWEEKLDRNNHEKLDMLIFVKGRFILKKYSAVFLVSQTNKRDSEKIGLNFYIVISL